MKLEKSIPVSKNLLDREEILLDVGMHYKQKFVIIDLFHRRKCRIMEFLWFYNKNFEKNLVI